MCLVENVETNTPSAPRSGNFFEAGGVRTKNIPLGRAEPLPRAAGFFFGICITSICPAQRIFSFWEYPPSAQRSGDFLSQRTFLFWAYPPSAPLSSFFYEKSYNPEKKL